jgi:hypothetical protein
MPVGGPHKKWRILLACILIVLPVNCGLANPPEDAGVSIKLDAPSQVGKCYDIDRIHSDTVRIETAYPDKAPATENSKQIFHIKATITVLAVDTKGNENRTSIAVHECTEETESSGKVNVFPPDAMITAENKGGRSLFHCDNIRLDAQQLRALAVLVRPAKPEEPTRSESYPVIGPVKVGSRWPMNLTPWLKFENRDENSTKGVPSGDAEFLGMVEKTGKKYAKVRTTLKEKNAPITVDMESAKNMEFDLESSRTALIPQDLLDVYSSSEGETKWTGAISGHDSNGVPFQKKMEITSASSETTSAPPK